MLPLRHWHEMTTDDFGASETSRWIAVVPVAAIEQHGPHLPVNTDTCIAEGLIRRSIKLLPDDLPVTFLPIHTRVVPCKLFLRIKDYELSSL